VNKSLKCLLLDDELPGLTYLKMLCEQMSGLEVVKAFNRPELFLQEVGKLEFDLCILDIEMAGTDGLQIARLLADKPVIFTTAYKEYAADAFEINAVDYVLKPIQKERLQIAVNKAAKRVEELSNTPVFIRLNTDKGRTLLYFTNLAYLTTSTIDSRDKTAILRDDSSLTLKNISFEKLLRLLPSCQFCQVNKREIISLTAVRFFSHDEITTNLMVGNNPLVLHLSEAYRNEFMRKTQQ